MKKLLMFGVLALGLTAIVAPKVMACDCGNKPKTEKPAPAPAPAPEETE